jgi:hypothetical protein
MGERIGRIGRIRTDFFGLICTDFKQKNQKKFVYIRPIRPIRSPIVSPPSKTEIADKPTIFYHFKIFRMKKILMPIVLIALYLNPLAAQIKQGSWMIGGNGNFYQTHFLDKTGRSNSSFKYKNVYLNTELGYFVTNYWMLGVRVGASLSSTTFENLSGQTQRQTNYESYSLEPFTRIYFTPQHRFKLFYELSGGGFMAKSKDVLRDSMSRRGGFSMGNSIGADYFLTDNIAIEGFINYNFYTKIQYADRIEETAFAKFIWNPTFRIRLFLNTKGETIGLSEKYFEKGNLTYGIRMNLLLNDNNRFNTSNFTPSFGYFVMDNLMIGSEFSIYYAPNSIFGVYLMPEVRYYQPLSRLTQWFGRMRFSSTYSVDNGNGFVSKFRRHETEMGVGLNRFLAPNISVQSSVNVAISANNLSSIFEIRPNLRIGFQYFMSKK